VPRQEGDRLVSDDGYYWWDGRGWRPMWPPQPPPPPGPAQRPQAGQPGQLEGPYQQVQLVQPVTPGLAVRESAAPERRRASLALWLGLGGLLTWLVPLVGIPVSVVGGGLAVSSLHGSGRARAGLALALCALGLVLSVAAWIVAARLLQDAIKLS
jgi:hypothetical protein